MIIRFVLITQVIKVIECNSTLEFMLPSKGDYIEIETELFEVTHKLFKYETNELIINLFRKTF